MRPRAPEICRGGLGERDEGGGRDGEEMEIWRKMKKKKKKNKRREIVVNNHCQSEREGRRCLFI